jgi:hypothetical protein
MQYLPLIIAGAALMAVLAHQFTGHKIHLKALAVLFPMWFQWPNTTPHERHGQLNHWYKDWGTVMWLALMAGVIAYFFNQSSS